MLKKKSLYKWGARAVCQFSNASWKPARVSKECGYVWVCVLYNWKQFFCLIKRTAYSISCKQRWIELKNHLVFIFQNFEPVHLLFPRSSHYYMGRLHSQGKLDLTRKESFIRVLFRAIFSSFIKVREEHKPIPVFTKNMSRHWFCY